MTAVPASVARLPDALPRAAAGYSCILRQPGDCPVPAPAEKTGAAAGAEG